MAGISRSAFFRLRSRDIPGFPKPLDLPGTRPHYRISDIEKWVASLKPARRKRLGVAAPADAPSA
jgi:predicted DNA-binding transcriptional regulator AlpA